MTATLPHHRALVAAARRLMEAVCRWAGTEEEARREFPFLERWTEGQPEPWEEILADPSPLSALARAGDLGPDHLTALSLVGLVEEDARFGLVWEGLHASPTQRRPTRGALSLWWPELRGPARDLEELGVLVARGDELSPGEAPLSVPAPLWDALRGDRNRRPTPWARYRPPEELPELGALRLPPAVREQLSRLPPGVTRIVRGPSHNGRFTLLSALARSEGRGVLEVELAGADEGRFGLLGPLATALGASIVLRVSAGAGEIVRLPALQACDSPVGVVAGMHGGVSGPLAERAVTLRLPLPDAASRAEHWADTGAPLLDLPAVARRFRLSSGNLRRAAPLAVQEAALEGRAQVEVPDVQRATRALARAAMETLATPLEPVSGWTRLAVPETTAAELRGLETRCRHRERLCQAAGAGFQGTLTPGVRALFTGASGTGKTLAARLLAGALDMDLYRLDLSAVVNKYIGETEKSLNQVLTRAEELDLVLLIDEVDALMTKRTQVASSNDRYANLETNYLLQRLDSFEGVLLVTTNAADRIDPAFQRRMDVVVDFTAPDSAERRRIWEIHLPVDHALDEASLLELSERCRLTGGQIRNAALHATLLGLDQGGGPGRALVWEAVAREYRKHGAPCPLRRA